MSQFLFRLKSTASVLVALISSLQDFRYTRDTFAAVTTVMSIASAARSEREKQQCLSEGDGCRHLPRNRRIRIGGKNWVNLKLTGGRPDMGPSHVSRSATTI